jgi:hypothetical protein
MRATCHHIRRPYPTWDRGRYQGMRRRFRLDDCRRSGRWRRIAGGCPGRAKHQSTRDGGESYTRGSMHGQPWIRR